MSEVLIHDLMPYDGIKIFQEKDGFRFSLDSLLLANFVDINPRAQKIIEFGCGNGAILLYLSLKTKIDLIGIDIQEASIELAKKSIELNGLGNQIKVFNYDIKHISNHFIPSSFDFVVTNPPFFKVGEVKVVNQKHGLSLSRHELGVTFEEIVVSAKKMLKTSGAFCFVHRSDRLEEIISVLSKERFVLKRMRYVYTKPHSDSLMVLVEARYNGKTGSVRVLEPLYIYDNNQNYTQEVLDIFHLGDESYVKNS